MALTPQNSEAFLREVDDELRRDQMTDLWTRHGKLMIGGVVLVLALIAGVIWWRAHTAEKAGVAGETLSQALQDLSDRQEAPAKAKLATLDDAGPGYAAVGRLTSAALLGQQGKAGEASAAFRAITADGKAPQPLRDIATLRAAVTDFDTAPPAEIVARLKSLAVPGNPFFGTAGEMTALAQVKLGQTRQAIVLLGEVQRDDLVPDSIRDRAKRVAASLASPPGPPLAASAPAPALSPTTAASPKP